MLVIGTMDMLNSGKKFKCRKLSTFISILLVGLSNKTATADENVSKYNTNFLFNAENVESLMLNSETKDILVDIYVNNNFIVQDYVSRLSQSMYIPSNSEFMRLGFAGNIKEFARMLNSGVIRSEYNQSRQSINYQVPQKYLTNKDVVYNNWQEGMDGIYVNYQINARKSLSKNHTDWCFNGISCTLSQKTDSLSKGRCFASIKITLRSCSPFAEIFAKGGVIMNGGSSFPLAAVAPAQVTGILSTLLTPEALLSFTSPFAILGRFNSCTVVCTVQLCSTTLPVI